MKRNKKGRSKFTRIRNNMDERERNQPKWYSIYTVQLVIQKIGVPTVPKVQVKQINFFVLSMYFISHHL